MVFDVCNLYNKPIGYVSVLMLLGLYSVLMLVYSKPVSAWKVLAVGYLYILLLLALPVAMGVRFSDYPRLLSCYGSIYAGSLAGATIASLMFTGYLLNYGKFVGPFIAAGIIILLNALVDSMDYDESIDMFELLIGVVLMLMGVALAIAKKKPWRSERRKV